MSISVEELIKALQKVPNKKARIRLFAGNEVDDLASIVFNLITGTVDLIDYVMDE